jgi:hypothetical protein
MPPTRVLPLVQHGGLNRRSGRVALGAAVRHGLRRVALQVRPSRLSPADAVDTGLPALRGIAGLGVHRSDQPHPDDLAQKSRPHHGNRRPASRPPEESRHAGRLLRHDRAGGGYGMNFFLPQKPQELRSDSHRESLSSDGPKNQSHAISTLPIGPPPFTTAPEHTPSPAQGSALPGTGGVRPAPSHLLAGRPCPAPWRRATAAISQPRAGRVRRSGYRVSHADARGA